MSDREWPEMCLGDNELRPEISEPFRVGDETVYTNGRVMVAVPAGDDMAEDSEHRVYETTKRMLADIAPDGPTFALDWLRTWCAVPDVDPKCEECGGEGIVECECDCGHEHDAECDICEGVGTTLRPYDLVGLIDGVYFDRRLLFPVIGDAPGESLTITRAEHPGHAISLVSEDWRGLLMPLRSPEDAGVEYGEIIELREIVEAA